MRQVLLLAFIFPLITNAQDSILIPNPCHVIPPPILSDSIIITSSEITPNIYKGLGYSDTKKIQLALNDATALGQRLVIGYNDERSSNLWLIDSAVLLASNTDILIKNAKLKLTDSARDNIFRTANCGFGITNPASTPIENISIVGNGNAILEGADNPRSSGDYKKTLTLMPDYSFTQSYGTDAGKAGRSQTGDWRNYGVIIAYASNVVVSGLSLNYLHAYGISFQRTNHVRVRDIEINMPGYAANGDIS